MTPNTSDRPEAMRNRNIAVVSPLRNWAAIRETVMASARSPRYVGAY
jgi:hypothetical protein